jgi:hypothetical protein
MINVCLKVGLREQREKEKKLAQHQPEENLFLFTRVESMIDRWLRRSVQRYINLERPDK